MEKTLGGKTVRVSDDGYLSEPSQWDKNIAEEIAKEEGVSLTEKHYQVLDFLRTKHNEGTTLTIRSVGKSGIVDIKEFYALFPGGPLKKATKIAGIPKPSSCV